MTGYPWIIILFAMQFVIASVSSMYSYHPNHKYDDEADLTDEETQSLIAPEHMNPSENRVATQLRSPLNLHLVAKEQLPTLGVSKFASASPAINKRNYDNFVTPKEEGSFKHYEVTTKKFVDAKPESEPSALGVDNDIAIALDEEEDVDEEEYEQETPRPEHLNPLVYVDSYGRLHGKQQRPQGTGYGIGYGETQSRVPHRHPYRKKTTGRVRVQVFRGPTRIVGNKKYAPWGYYVVQPADSYKGGPHRYPGPPYIHR